MGTDNLFKKRKARKVRDLKRKAKNKAPYGRVLIVCEGSKTEPEYFKDLRDYYQLKTANIEICGEECDSSPSKVLQYAERLYHEEKDIGNPFDRVYCVFDKDTHTTYTSTVDAINRKRDKNTWFAITSIPSFEYWILLHFFASTKPYQPLPGNSAANQLLSELLTYLPEYSKGQKGLFIQLVPQLEFAKQNAIRLLKAAEVNGTDNPSTRVHELVEYLQNLNRPR